MNYKNKLKKKYFALEKKGLISYAKYLDKEWETSKDKKSKKKYSKYIAKEITRYKKRIDKIDKKLGL